jgi:hypothetical protein
LIYVKVLFYLFNFIFLLVAKEQNCEWGSCCSYCLGGMLPVAGLVASLGSFLFTLALWEKKKKRVQYHGP